jgi:hypothetical protein
MTCAVRQLGNGEIGYCMTPDRHDDCLRPALATVLQVPPGQIPDMRIDERVLNGDSLSDIARDGWAAIDAWLLGFGLEMVFGLPTRRGGRPTFPKIVYRDEYHVQRVKTIARWIGVVRPFKMVEPLPGNQSAEALMARFEDLLGASSPSYRRLQDEQSWDHCLVMQEDEILFDPAVGIPPPPGARRRTYDPSEIVYTITVVARKETN